MTALMHELLDPRREGAELQLPRDEHTPTFSEPWQAEALATTVEMSRRGVFTWKQWVQAFSAEIAAHPQRTLEDANTAYYRQWLTALEKLLCELELTDPQSIADTMQDWRLSYIHTPHGEAVTFRRALPAASFHEGEHHHHHDHKLRAKPIAVSRAVHR
ncbi:nitrile hydratase accessory protein [Variovorax sp. SRS16]|uniref:nitrile hydratase accessory protein n=1 Tax=Variovorax sp. SRS16 TaxID=282217 RepID=UPI001315DF92|nr:nitrile hydratase accessory protein [Variovorax sp. SRS16]VTU31146.1 nitrile hydratase accessory protein [Variovorax sp. SRS16]